MQLSLITATHYRARTLQTIALPSLHRQVDCDFEWVVINDGADAATRELIAQVQAQFAIRYLEMEHPTVGFGLCHARNLGLSVATGEWVAYLDDDNAIDPQFVAATQQFFMTHPNLQCAMVQQMRRREVVRDSQVKRSGASFVSPQAGTTVTALMQQQALFDSNGFAHTRQDAPVWNPGFQVFADYEYFLQCLDRWGRDQFGLHEQVLVDYVQSSQGVIGRSSYHQWVQELQLLLDQKPPILREQEREVLARWAQIWQAKADQGRSIPGFTVEMES